MESILTQPLNAREKLNDLGFAGRVITDETKEVLSHALSVAKTWASVRESDGSVPEVWRTVCSKRSSKKEHYSPRWTFPVFYFRMPIAQHLVGASGIDIGARVSDLVQSVSILRLRVPPDLEPDDLRESFVPHYAYYEDIGCRMQAIDISARSEDEPLTRGDARMLPYPSESFDFITAPLLIGPQNVCATPIEIALCISEFERVLRPGGFFYLADPTVEPSVIYAAQLAAFECYYSKGRCCGLPVGTVFKRAGSSDTTDRFQPVFENLKNCSLALSDQGDQVVWFADLLEDQQTPSVESFPH